MPGPGGLIDRQLPAPMQLGSGTIDLLPSVTLNKQYDQWSFGGQIGGKIRIDENHHGYSLGDAFQLLGYLGYNLTSWLSLEGGISYEWQDEMDGQQDGLMLAPPFAPTRRTVTTAFSEN